MQLGSLTMSRSAKLYTVLRGGGEDMKLTRNFGIWRHVDGFVIITIAAIIIRVHTLCRNITEILN
jgi:hypothetical protein